MIIDVDKPVSSLKTILNTIDADDQTFSWFYYFLSQKEAKATLLSSAPNLQKTYQLIFQLEAMENFINLLLITDLLLYIKFKAFYLLVLPFFFLVIQEVLYNKRKKAVIPLSNAFLTATVTEDQLTQKTLYETAEILSRKYGQLSLIDIIYFRENFSKFSFFSLFLLFLSPLFFDDPAPTLLLFLVAIFMLKNIVRSKWFIHLGSRLKIIF